MLPALAVVLLGLTACTFVAAGPPERTATPQPYAIDQRAVAEALGPVPEGEPMTPERAADFIQRFQDYRWELVAQSYPHAVRPAVTVVDTTGSGVTACVSDGSMMVEEVALSDYVCFAQNPPVPPAALSDEQAAYLYDYWTGFVVPCYAENGYEMEQQPPSRDYFVTHWPFQNWSPRPSTLGGKEIIDIYQQLDGLCPSTPEELM